MKYVYTVKNREIILKDTSSEIVIYLFGDVHRDARSCDADRWKQFLKDCKEDPADNKYYFCLGDANDFASFSERKHINQGQLHETTIDKLDELAERDNRLFAKECSFMSPNLLGIIEGNHTWSFQTGKTGAEDLADRLQSECLGWLCHYTLILRVANTKIMVPVHLSLCHGKGAGKRSGSSINGVEDLKNIFPNSHIIAMGHDHQRAIKPESLLVPTVYNNGVKIRQLEQFLIRTGTFKKAYEPDDYGYEIKALYKPSNIGAVKLTIKLNKYYYNNNDHYEPKIRAEI